MRRRSFSIRISVYGILTILVAHFATFPDVLAQTLVPTSGSVDWNNDANWSSPPYPDASGASATIPAPTDALIINLNEPITIGSLNIEKAASGAIETTIQGSDTNVLTFDGGSMTLANDVAGAAGNGATIIEAPIAITSTLNIQQGDNSGLRLMEAISGNGGLNISRVGTGVTGSGVIALSGDNTYSGATVLTGSAGPEYLLVRLNHANAIPGGVGATGGTSNIQFTDSAVLGLNASDFERSIGTGADQFQFVEPVQSGWAAFALDRTVNIGGNSDTIAWDTAGFNPNILILSHVTADKTLTFENPLDLLTGSSTAEVNRNIRAPNGSAAIDAIVSGGLTQSNTNGTANMVFWASGAGSGGTIRLTGPSTYTGTTTIRDGAVVILDHADALAPGNLILMTQSSVLGLGPSYPTFTRSLGTGAGEVRFTGQNGFAAYGGDRVVNLGGSGATVTWNTTNFVPSGSALVLAHDNSDGMLDFQNAINLNNDERSIAVRDGSAPIDATLSGVISSPLELGGLVKNLAGTLALTNANTYGGPTTINAGTLLVNNTSGSGTGTGSVTVTNTATLGGTGSIAGTVTVQSGGHVAPGVGVESLDVGALVLEVGSILNFDLGAPGSPGVGSDLLNVTLPNGLTINGGAVELANAGGLSAGTYTLIDYAGAINGDVASLGTPTGPVGFSYMLVNNAVNTSIDLIVAAAGFSGDYNEDGSVDAADYVVWRKNPAALGGDPGYDAWVENFGSGSPGSGGLQNGAVPEPSAMLLVVVTAIGLLPRFRRR